MNPDDITPIYLAFEQSEIESSSKEEIEANYSAIDELFTELKPIEPEKNDD